MEKIFRDPVHDVMKLRADNKKDTELIFKLIDTVEFQRLRYIRQTGLSYFTYPGAQHSRFEHSLGTAYLARSIAGKIQALIKEKCIQYKKSKAWKTAGEKIKTEKSLIIIASLLHDIGHGPFSHTFEKIFFNKSITHEDWTREIILSNSTQIGALLQEFDNSLNDCPPKTSKIKESLGNKTNGSLQENIANIISKKYRNKAAKKIISSQLDVDRLDYILRDSKMTGVMYGNFDIKWLINVLAIGMHQPSSSNNIEVGIDLSKGIVVAEDFIISRYNMYKNVYLHKATVGAEILLTKILQRAKFIIETPGELKIFINDSLARLMRVTKDNIQENIKHYIRITDDDIIYHIREWAYTSIDLVLKDLSQRFLERKLFKCISNQRLDMSTSRKLRALLEEKYGKNAEYYYAEYSLEVTAYKNPFSFGSSHDNSVYLFDRNGVSRELSEVSPLILALKSTFDETKKMTRVYVASDLYEKARLLTT